MFGMMVITNAGVALVRQAASGTKIRLTCTNVEKNPE